MSELTHIDDLKKKIAIMRQRSVNSIALDVEYLEALMSDINELTTTSNNHKDENSEKREGYILHGGCFR